MLNQPTGPKGAGQRPGLPPDTRKNGAPGWASGLKNMYDSVVNEPLPDSFEDLLKKLDESKDD